MQDSIDEKQTKGNNECEKAGRTPDEPSGLI